MGQASGDGISRADVKAMIASIKAPILANQVLAAASAIFAWGIKEEIVMVNPCQLVEKNATRSRERVLSDSEISSFWRAFDDAGLLAGTALKLILLTGQRPGEVTHMHRDHIVDGWWEMPGAPVLDAIKQAGIEDNKLVIFTSDNGPEGTNPWQGDPGPWRGHLLYGDGSLTACAFHHPLAGQGASWSR